MTIFFRLKNKEGKFFTASKIPGARIETTSLSRSKREYVDGLPSYQLQDGTALNKLPDGTFQNALTGEHLTAV
jgi:hypothetical protein